MLVAPALHVHPTTDTILRYLSPEIDWELLGLTSAGGRRYGLCSGSAQCGRHAWRCQLKQFAENPGFSMSSP